MLGLGMIIGVRNAQQGTWDRSATSQEDHMVRKVEMLATKAGGIEGESAPEREGRRTADEPQRARAQGARRRHGRRRLLQSQLARPRGPRVITDRACDDRRATHGSREIERRAREASRIAWPLAPRFPRRAHDRPRSRRRGRAAARCRPTPRSSPRSCSLLTVLFPAARARRRDVLGRPRRVPPP